MKLQSVQALRGVAAFLVVLFHCAEIQRAGLESDRRSEIDLLSGFWDRGYAGVDLFFVISGFVMVYATKNYHAKDIGRFLYKRAMRVYPLWWVFASIMGIYFFMSYGQVAPPDRMSVEGSAAYFLKSLILIPQENVPVLIVGWTLIHELYFYLIFAFSLFFSRRFLPLFLTIWAGLTCICFAMGFSRSMVQGVPSLLSSLLTLEFIAGALLAWFMLEKQMKYGAIFFAIGAISFVIALIFYTDRSSDMTQWGRILVYTLPCLAMLGGLVSWEYSKKTEINNWLSRLGDWSYGLYLSHILVIFAMRRLFQVLEPAMPDVLVYQSEGWIDNMFFWVVTIAACIFIAAFSYRFVEQPLLRQSRKLYT